jgi:hypothetical protein
VLALDSALQIQVPVRFGAMAQAGGGRVAHIARSVTMSAAPATAVSVMQHDAQK